MGAAFREATSVEHMRAWRSAAPTADFTRSKLRGEGRRGRWANAHGEGSFDGRTLLVLEQGQAGELFKQEEFSEEAFSGFEAESHTAALGVSILCFEVILEVGEAFAEPEQRSEVSIAGLRDKMLHGAIVANESAGPAAEPSEVGIFIELVELFGFIAPSRGFKVEEVPNVASLP